MTSVALVAGPAVHAVVRHGVRLARAGGLPVARDVARVPSGSAVLWELTDRLLGPCVDTATEAAGIALMELAGRDCRVVVALHDVPAADDWSPARRALYARLASVACGVVVCSDVEAGRARDLGARRITVAPIPVDPPPPVRTPADRPPESVTVAGFVWPGKGHAEVLAAMSVLPAGAPLVIAGDAAAGHRDEVAALTGSGRPVRVTGFTPDADFARLLGAPTIPVAPNRAVSASASIASWWSAGRRPLVPAVPYIRELAARNPGALWLYDELPPALTAAWAYPDRTWLPTGLTPGPGLAEVAEIRRQALLRWCG